jgi:hypothetical protein
MSDKSPLSVIEKSMREYDQGHMIEYEKPDGSIGLVNKLDLEVARKYKSAVAQESKERSDNSNLTLIIFGLLIVIIILAMYIFYINITTDLTGIYYDKDGKKIELHHNKTLGTISTNDNNSLSEGVVKKESSNIYSLYFNNSLEAYADVKAHTIKWANNLWVKDI